MYASLLVYMFSMCCLAVLIHFAGTENDGQEVKPDAEGVRNVSPQHTEDVPQIRSSVNERSPSGNFIADHIIIGRPGFNVRDECKPKGIKM